MPVMVVSLVLTWREHWVSGVAGIGLHTVAWWEAGTGLCSRCAHRNCGWHGWVVRRVFGVRTAPLSKARKILHLGMDAALAAWWMGWW